MNPIAMSNIQRNAPCSCGSGKKYKKCCLGKQNTSAGASIIHPEEVADKLNKLRVCLLNRNIIEARLYCNELIRAQPNNPNVLYCHAFTAQTEGNYDEAIRIYKTLLTKTTDHRSKIAMELGCCHLFIGQIEEAAVFFGNALKLDAKNGEHRLFQGIAYLMQGKQQEAEELFQKIREQDNDKPERTLGLVFAVLGKVDEAVEIYYPIAKSAIISDAPRKPYYDYDQVLSSKSVEIQSQRFNMTPEHKMQIVESIKSYLELVPGDTLLDIGGAGGLFTIECARLVKSIMLTDINRDLVECARANTLHLGNVEVCVDDAISMSNVSGIYNKVLMYGVSQMLPCFDDLEKVLGNIFDHLAPNGKVLIGYNLGTGNLEQFIKQFFSNNPRGIYGYARYQQLCNQIFIFENSLLIDKERLAAACNRIGYSRVTVFHNPFITSTYNVADMFDLVLEK